jgi:hypothetical protein
VIPWDFNSSGVYRYRQATREPRRVRGSRALGRRETRRPTGSVFGPLLSLRFPAANSGALGLTRLRSRDSLAGDATLPAPEQESPQAPADQSTSGVAPMIADARASLASAIEKLEGLVDRDLPTVLGDGLLDRFLRAIARPKDAGDPRYPMIYDYFAAHKHGLQLLALVRHAITYNYAVECTVDQSKVYVSPDYHQWFDDGVMFLQGQDRFAGAFGLYQGGRVKFAISARDVRKGEKLGPSDFVYVDVEDALTRIASRPRADLSELRRAQADLSELLNRREENEVEYQRYLERYPWAFGAQYSSVDSHEALDDENIPDFSGVRVRDGARDILEIKSPFLSLFRADGTFAAPFNDAWNQTERYLDFTRREVDYLRRQKGLRFENPHCHLIIGYEVTDDELEKLRRKERMNAAITILTYDDLEALVRHTVGFVETLRAATIPTEA